MTSVGAASVLATLSVSADRLLLSALEAPASALRSVGAQVIRGRSAVGVGVAAGPRTQVFWFDAVTSALMVVDSITAQVSLANNPVVSIEFANWAWVDNVRLPLTIAMKQRGEVFNLQTVSAWAVNPTTDTLFSEPVTKIRQIPLTTRLREVASGIYRYEFVSHSPVVVQQGDSLIIFDAVISDGFMRELLDTLAARLPAAKPKLFVVSHHHADHVDGAPALFTAGLQALAAPEIVDHVRALRLNPDSRAARRRVVRPIRDSMVVGEGVNRFVLLRVPSEHAVGLTMAWFPEARVLVEVDLAAGSPMNQREFLDFVNTKGLSGARISRMHGPIQSLEDYIKALPQPLPAPIPKAGNAPR